SPQKSKSRQRVYTRKDIELILEIKNLLYKEKFTLKGAKKRLKELHQKADKFKQIDLPIIEKEHLSTLKNIKKELSSIQKILQTGA
ncbi:MAG: MerR family transcriptional regulator, partial [Proteobacteria bacterium]|nr:MerR family transcriptional regulator [Pseudomonadota bacterium]